MDSLPVELIIQILELADIGDVLNLAKTCQRFKNITSDSQYWADRARREYGVLNTTFNMLEGNPAYLYFHIKSIASREAEDSARDIMLAIVKGDLKSFNIYLDLLRGHLNGKLKAEHFFGKVKHLYKGHDMDIIMDSLLHTSIGLDKSKFVRLLLDVHDYDSVYLDQCKNLDMLNLVLSKETISLKYNYLSRIDFITRLLDDERFDPFLNHSDLLLTCIDKKEWTLVAKLADRLRGGHPNIQRILIDPVFKTLTKANQFDLAHDLYNILYTNYRWD